MEVKTILNEINNTIIIEKSKFITYLCPISDKNEASEKLKEIRNIHPLATHVCYGFIINDEGVLLYKSSDDGEPSSTAGAPILNVLKKNEVSNVLCAVVRYFGGVKLGAGGLVRAYSNSASEALEKACLVTYVDAFKGEFIFDYDKINFIDKYFESNNIEIIEKKYDLKVAYQVITYKKEDVEEILKKISYMGISYNELGNVVTKKKI